MAYDISIEICGRGEDPKRRSHWGFVICKSQSRVGDLLHVQLIDLEKLWYQYESRTNVQLPSMQAVGMVQIGVLSEQERQEAIRVIASEPAPRDGTKRCQDWIFDTLLSLEAEDLVPSGTCHFWKDMVGKPAKDVQEATKEKWIELD